MNFTTAALVVAWLAILLLAFGFAGLMAQVTELRRALGQASGGGHAGHGHGGAAGPAIGLALPASGDLAVLRPAGGGIIAFVSPGCPSCAGVLQDLAAVPPAGELVVVSTGDCGDLPVGLAATCHARAGHLLSALRVPATPYLVSVDAAGTIADVILPLDHDDLNHWLTHDAARKDALS